MAIFWLPDVAQNRLSTAELGVDDLRISDLFSAIYNFSWILSGQAKDNDRSGSAGSFGIAGRDGTAGMFSDSVGKAGRLTAGISGLKDGSVGNDNVGSVGIAGRDGTAGMFNDSVGKAGKLTAGISGLKDGSVGNDKVGKAGSVGIDGITGMFSDRVGKAGKTAQLMLLSYSSPMLWAIVLKMPVPEPP